MATVTHPSHNPHPQGPVTVLGGRGYIGQHLVQGLRHSGLDPWVPQRDDPAVFERPLGVVYFCVGLTADFRSRPFETVDAHVGFLRQLLQHAHFDQLVYLSSTRVYLGAAGTQEDQALVVRPQDADDLYKLSKLMGESLALNSGRHCKVVRLSNVVGGEHGNPDSFVYSLLADARRGHVVLRSHPDSAKDYVHIDDVVDLLPQIAHRGQHPTYNLASGRQTTHRQWLEAICNATGAIWETADHCPLQAFAPIDVQRIQREFGFKAAWPVERFIPHTPSSALTTPQRPL